jgi:hypothetical protein
VSEHRLKDLKRFYSILDRQKVHLGGTRTLDVCDGKMGWPERAVYFFFENDEVRSAPGTGQRVVRVGTHALREGSRTNLWHRLSQHRGVQRTGGGNHRGSVFRLHVRSALLNRDQQIGGPSWSEGSSAVTDTRKKEHDLEVMVGGVIRNMPFLWVAIEDPAGPRSGRGHIERNAISLLSNFNRPSLDAPSANWLGNHSESERARESGLWNSKHVGESYECSFLDGLEELAAASVAP